MALTWSHRRANWFTEWQLNCWLNSVDNFRNVSEAWLHTIELITKGESALCTHVALVTVIGNDRLGRLYFKSGWLLLFFFL